ncbi:hypothetical protein VCHA53O466_50273 [Vibrio chagasii]|nr:hypothetical protein VCHA53O466_50273 [Vibrio chagasii]
MFEKGAFKKRAKSLRFTLKSFLKIHAVSLDGLNLDVEQIYLEKLINAGAIGFRLMEDVSYQHLPSELKRKLNDFISLANHDNSSQVYMADRLAIETVLSAANLNSETYVKGALKSFHKDTSTSINQPYPFEMSCLSSQPKAIENISESRGLLYTYNLKSMLPTAVSIHRDNLTRGYGSLWISSSATADEISKTLIQAGVSEDDIVTMEDPHTFIDSTLLEPDTLAGICFKFIEVEFEAGRISQRVMGLSSSLVSVVVKDMVHLCTTRFSNLMKFEVFARYYSGVLSLDAEEALMEYLDIRGSYGLSTSLGEIDDAVESRWRLVTSLYMSIHERVIGMFRVSSLSTSNFIDLMVFENKHVVITSDDSLRLYALGLIAREYRFDDGSLRERQESYREVRDNCPLFIEQRELMDFHLSNMPSSTYGLLMLQRNMFFDDVADDAVSAEDIACITANSDILVSHTVTDQYGGLLGRFSKRSVNEMHFWLRLVSKPYL